MKIINISPKITIPLGIVTFIVAGLTYNPIFATVGGVIFILGLHDFDSKYRKEQMKTSTLTKIILVTFLAVAVFVFWKFYY